jgi:hypothetical protein
MTDDEKRRYTPLAWAWYSAGLLPRPHKRPLVRMSDKERRSRFSESLRPQGDNPHD